MFVKMTLCATMMLLIPTPENGQKPAESDPAKTPKTAAETGQPPQTKKPEDLNLLPIEVNIVKYTNLQRAKHGLPQVEIDQDLMKSARQHASWMARSRRLVHTRRPVAENIAMGQRHSREAVSDWMHSPGHRANILNRRHCRIGVAAYRTAKGTIFWCQQFRH